MTQKEQIQILCEIKMKQANENIGQLCNKNAKCLKEFANDAFSLDFTERPNYVRFT